MAVFWIILVFLLVLSVILLSGRGGFLIAGYNTAGQKEKGKYDEKKLCRLTGAYMAVIAIFMLTTQLVPENVSDILWAVFFIVIIAATVLLMVLSNTICKRKDTETGAETLTEAEAEAEKIQAEKNKKLERGVWIFTIAVFAAAGIVLTTGDIKVTLLENKMEIAGSYWGDKTIEYDTIKEISYTDDFLTGDRRGGFGSFKLKQGTFKNAQFGSYTLYAYTSCQSYVIIETDTGMVVVNDKDKTRTEQLYQELTEKFKNAEAFLLRGARHA